MCIFKLSHPTLSIKVATAAKTSEMRLVWIGWLIIREKEAVAYSENPAVSVSQAPVATLAVALADATQTGDAYGVIPSDVELWLADGTETSENPLSVLSDASLWTQDSTSTSENPAGSLSDLSAWLLDSTVTGENPEVLGDSFGLWAIDSVSTGNVPQEKISDLQIDVTRTS